LPDGRNTGRTFLVSSLVITPARIALLTGAALLLPAERCAAQMDSSGARVGHATILSTAPDSEAICEDLAWDPARSLFVVTDVRRHLLRTVDLRGHWGTLGAPLAPGWAPLGIAIDAARGVIWIGAATLPQAEGYTPADSSRAAILRLDLATGRVLKRYDLPGRSRAAPGDLVLAANHDLYSGDGMIGAVYVIHASRDSLETLVPAGTVRSTQQPVILPGGRGLVVPVYGRGLVRVDTGTGAITWLRHPDGVTLVGIDGLLMRGRELIAVQNLREPNRIVRLFLDSSFTSVDSAAIVLRDTVLAAEPTHVASVEGTLYTIGNAGWSKFNDDGSPRAGIPRVAPRLLRLDAEVARPGALR